MSLKVGQIIYRVFKESYPEKDTAHTIERLTADGTKAVLRCLYLGKPSGKAVSVKIKNIKPGRPTSGTFNGTYYIGDGSD